MQVQKWWLAQQLLRGKDQAMNIAHLFVKIFGITNKKQYTWRLRSVGRPNFLGLLSGTPEKYHRRSSKRDWGKNCQFSYIDPTLVLGNKAGDFLIPFWALFSLILNSQMHPQGDSLPVDFGAAKKCCDIQPWQNMYLSQSFIPSENPIQPFTSESCCFSHLLTHAGWGQKSAAEHLITSLAMGKLYRQTPRVPAQHSKLI